MRLSVSGVHDLPALHDTGAVISIQDPSDGRPEDLYGLRVPILDLVFHDSDGQRGDLKPQAWHLVKVQRFLAELDGDTALHVHCFAGVSRSTAVACFVLAILEPGLTDTQIVRRVLDVRPVAMPNRLLLKHADALLGRHLQRTWTAQAGRY